MWEAALVLARAILDEQEKREAAAQDTQLANSIIAAVKTVIEQSVQQILDFLKQEQLDQIEGSVDGLFKTFVRYAADPSGTGNADRLRILIDDLAKLIGQMEIDLGRIGSDEDRALNTFPVYASAVSLSALAITERRLRFNVNEPFAGILQDASQDASNIKVVLRRRSDDRFKFAISTEEPGSVVFGYTFEGVFHGMQVVFHGQNPKAAHALVASEIANQQDREFPKYPGVQALLDFIAALDYTINNQLHVDALTDINAMPLAGAQSSKRIFLSPRLR